MRVKISFAVSCLICVLAASSANAGRFDLEWIATTGAGAVGSNSITVAPGDGLTLQLSMVVEPGGTLVHDYSVSLLFDPVELIGIGYAMNQMGPNLVGDPRSLRLLDAVYACL